MQRVVTICVAHDDAARPRHLADVVGSKSQIDSIVKASSAARPSRAAPLSIRRGRRERLSNRSVPAGFEGIRPLTLALCLVQPSQELHALAHGTRSIVRVICNARCALLKGLLHVSSPAPTAHFPPPLRARLRSRFPHESRTVSTTSAISSSSNSSSTRLVPP